MDPAGQADPLAGMIWAQLAAGMGTVGVHRESFRENLWQRRDRGRGISAQEAGKPALCQVRRLPLGACFGAFAGRSEEHTSELQSLMRIPYAVFCLKKKNK